MLKFLFWGVPKMHAGRIHVEEKDGRLQGEIFESQMVV